jgi:hypothetical protein
MKSFFSKLLSTPLRPLRAHSSHLTSQAQSVATMPLSDSDTDIPRPLTPTDPEGVTTGSLELLQSDEQRKILDIVDHLRRQGLSSLISLPQLVV